MCSYGLPGFRMVLSRIRTPLWGLAAAICGWVMGWVGQRVARRWASGVSRCSLLYQSSTLSMVRSMAYEVHPAPEKAISDRAQSLDLAQFERMTLELRPYIELWQASRKSETQALAAAN
jgi:hypothetical protein